MMVTIFGRASRGEIAAAVKRAVERDGAYRPRLFRKHAHRWCEFFFDLRPDVPGGPRTMHGIGWVCRCGKFKDGGSSVDVLPSESWEYGS